MFSISFLWSRAFLMHRGFLWLLFLCNLLGTVYGYIWYGGQLESTLDNYPVWLIVFVPDSPTASLFFTISLLFLMYPASSSWLKKTGHVIQALAFVTSLKYGIWAVVMIVAGWSLGVDMIWSDFMLIASHLAMAVEVLLYARFFGFRLGSLVFAGVWTLLNDTLDYTKGIYPGLPDAVDVYINRVRNFTVVLSLASILTGFIALRQTKRL
ncbi:Uncharacterized membrane protein YpjA [Paenibacillus sp. PDC88]|nr:Uncharacterized membrane protein YpjA [Paenibacillus sp. PDC88]